MEVKQDLYFDPFAEDGSELFDPIDSFSQLRQAYEEGRITHDYSADEFVAKTEALMMDAIFVERFDAVQAIASQMHQLCGEDHGLRQQLGSSMISGINDSHSENDGHNHTEDKHHTLDDEDDDDEELSIFGTKKRKKRRK